MRSPSAAGRATCDAGLAEGIAEHAGEDGKYVPGVAIPIARARLRIRDFDRTRQRPGPPTAKRSFACAWRPDRPCLNTWFQDQTGAALLSAYYAYIERRETSGAVRLIFDTRYHGRR